MDRDVRPYEAIVYIEKHPAEALCGPVSNFSIIIEKKELPVPGEVNRISALPALNDHSVHSQEDTMLDRIKEEIDSAQERIRDVSDRISDQRGDWVRTARHQVHIARGEGQERLWKLEHRALDLANNVLDKADEVPGTARMAESLEKLVDQRRTTSLAVPVDGYESLNARAAAGAVRDLDLVALLKVERFEGENKTRKTVFQAIERRRKELSKPPFQVSETEG